jgi:transaldolase
MAAMKIFIDTGNISEIREAAAMGLLDGVTTNPSLVAKSGQPFKELLLEICAIVDGDISAEVISLKADEMVAEGEQLARIHRNIVVKIPLIPEGLKAIKILKTKGIRVNCTLCFSAVQALLAAKAGAYIISPFIGRIDDRAERGMDIIEEIRTIYDNYGFKTMILAASIRSPLHVKECALAGADIATMPFSVLMELARNPLTDAGLKKFLDDWEKAKK